MSKDLTFSFPSFEMSLNVYKKFSYFSIETDEYRSVYIVLDEKKVTSS